MTVVITAAINWNDRYANEPNLMVVLDEPLVFPEEWNTSPIKGERETFYWREADDFYTYFVWSGKPDHGFGGWKRTIKLVEGGEREIVGGWSSNPSVFPLAGLPDVLEVSVYALTGKGKKLGGPLSLALDHGRVHDVVREHCPGIEVIETGRAYTPLTFKFEGEVSKAEWQDQEDARISPIRDALREQYGQLWYSLCTDQERHEINSRPYSGIGGREVQQPITEQFWAQEALR